ncbi:MAG: hypothetical protein ABJN42_19870 [Roseibium sp.]
MSEVRIRSIEMCHCGLFILRWKPHQGDLFLAKLLILTFFQDERQEIFMALPVQTKHVYIFFPLKAATSAATIEDAEKTERPMSKTEDVFPTDTSRDWPEGLYMGNCRSCQCRFQGPKRARHCHPCHLEQATAAEAERAAAQTPLTMSMVQERVARAWAEIDGRADRFDACKSDPEIEDIEGRYEGYMAEAEALLKNSGLKDILAKNGLVMP